MSRVLVALYVAATLVYAHRRVDESRVQLERLSSHCPPRLKGQTAQIQWELGLAYAVLGRWGRALETLKDRKSTRLNSSHANISYAVFCLKKKKKNTYKSTTESHRTNRVIDSILSHS